MFVTNSGRSAWFVGVHVLMVYLIFAMTRCICCRRLRSKTDLPVGCLQAVSHRRSQIMSTEARRDRSQSGRMRRLFFRELVQQLHVVWPILSGILLIMIGSGVIIWRIEGWRLDEALYFTFVTGLTIGYGDFTPKHVSARLLSLVIGFAGIVLTGLVAAVTVQALGETDRDSAE